MAMLFPAQAFCGFGPTVIRPSQFDASHGRVKSRKASKIRDAVRADAPKLPGVYGMLGSRGELIYVGKAKSLRARLMSYFRGSRDPKAGRILQHTYALVWETAPDEFGALVRELELIRRHRPRMNVIGQPGRQFHSYLCLGHAPAPHAYRTMKPSGKDLAVFGPFSSAQRVTDAVRRLNDFYKLRDCPSSVPMYFSEQKSLFPEERDAKCLRYDIDTCAGPCAGKCSRPGYSAHVRAARRFLEGSDDRPLKVLAAQMQEASSALLFERAALLRDRLDSLQWIWDRTNWLRTARRDNTFIYPLTGPDQRTVWYMIHRGQVAGASYEPVCRGTARVAAELIDEIYAGPHEPGAAPNQVDHVLLVSGWLRKRPEDRARIIPWEQARSLAKQSKAT